MKKSFFQTVIFAILFVTMSGYTSELFTNIFYDVQTEGKEEIKKWQNISTLKYIN